MKREEAGTQMALIPGRVAELSRSLIRAISALAPGRGNKASRGAKTSLILSGFFCLLVSIGFLFGVLPPVFATPDLGVVAAPVLAATPLYILFHKMERGPNLPDLTICPVGQ